MRGVRAHTYSHECAKGFAVEPTVCVTCGSYVNSSYEGGCQNHHQNSKTCIAKTGTHTSKCLRAWLRYLQKILEYRGGNQSSICSKGYTNNH